MNGMDDLEKLWWQDIKKQDSVSQHVSSFLDAIRKGEAELVFNNSGVDYVNVTFNYDYRHHIEGIDINQ
jgi:hypothetical protein